MPSRSSAPPASAPATPQIVLVQDREFNAFVASGRRMVVFTGTLMQAKTPNEVIGVIAHETGHLAGGHLENLRNEIARSQAIGAALSLLGMAGIAAGAAAGFDTAARMGGAAVSMGPAVTVRSLLTYQPRAGACRRPRRPRLSERHRPVRPRAWSASSSASPTSSSCPPNMSTLTRRAIRWRATASSSCATSAEASQFWPAKDSAELQLRHDMMRAKLSAFTEGATAAGRRYPRSDDSLPAQYARAIVAYRTGGTRQPCAPSTTSSAACRTTPISMS